VKRPRDSRTAGFSKRMWKLEEIESVEEAKKKSRSRKGQFRWGRRRWEYIGSHTDLAAKRCTIELLLKG